LSWRTVRVVRIAESSRAGGDDDLARFGNLSATQQLPVGGVAHKRRETVRVGALGELFHRVDHQDLLGRDTGVQ
jgi:hypothetical protein